MHTAPPTWTNALEVDSFPTDASNSTTSSNSGVKLFTGYERYCYCNEIIFCRFIRYSEAYNSNFINALTCIYTVVSGQYLCTDLHFALQHACNSLNKLISECRSMSLFTIISVKAQFRKWIRILVFLLSRHSNVINCR